MPDEHGTPTWDELKARIDERLGAWSFYRDGFVDAVAQAAQLVEGTPGPGHAAEALLDGLVAEAARRFGARYVRQGLADRLEPKLVERALRGVAGSAGG